MPNLQFHTSMLLAGQSDKRPQQPNVISTWAQGMVLSEENFSFHRNWVIFVVKKFLKW